jgi:O-antigen ligase
MTAPAATTGRPALTGVPRRRTATQVGIVLAVCALPLLRPAGPGNTGLVDVGVIVVMVVAVLWLSGHQQPIRFPYVLPVALGLVAGAVGGLAAGGGVLALSQDVFLLGWALAIANLGRSPALLGTLVRAWGLSVTGWAALLIAGVLVHVSWLSGQSGLDGSRASLTFGDPNLAADYFIVGLLVLRAAQVPRRRSARLLCCAVIVTAIVLTGSNGGMTALVLVTLAGWLFRLAREGRAPAALLAACVLATAGVVAASTVDLAGIAARARDSAPVLRDSIGREAESGGSRQTLVREAVSLWMRDDSPVGVGPGGTKGALQAEQAQYVKEAHDDYLAAVVERGILGGVALAWLVAMVAVRSRRIGRRDALRPEFAAVLPRPELLGAAAGAVLLSAMFYEVLHFRHVWALFGLIAAVELWGRRERGPRVPR